MVKSKKWLTTHLPGDHQLTQGLKARPHTSPPGQPAAANRSPSNAGQRFRPDQTTFSPAPSPQGDATYLIVKADGTLTDYGLNAVCTHLGCVVPWNSVCR